MGAVAAALALAGCLPRGSLPPSAPTPVFDPIAFFAGKTEGEGRLTTLTGSTKAVSVTSVGTRDGEGGINLKQHIVTEGEGARDRLWVIRPLGGGRYGGTLTEAVGPVVAEVRGNAMTIRYRTEDYRVVQRLVLARDGALANRLDVVKWGLNVARLEERIERR